MLIRNIKEFLIKIEEKKIICLDIGKKKIGLAISDTKHRISSPLSILKKDKSLYPNLKNVLTQYEIGGIIVGLPLDENLEFNRMCQFIKDITKNLDYYLQKNKFELPIFFWDESYTSFEAMTTTKNFFKNTKSQKKSIDKFAAQIILGDFLRENIKEHEKKN